MDIGYKKSSKKEFIDFEKAQENTRFFQSGNATLFSKGRRITEFFTEDSKLYITPKEQRMLERGIKLNRSLKKWDSLSRRVVRNYQAYCPKQSDIFYQKFQERYDNLREEIEQTSRNFLGQFSLARLWNISIVGALLLGMISMTFIYRYLGQGAAAGIALDNLNEKTQNERMLSESPSVLGVETQKNENIKLDFSQQPQISDFELANKDRIEFEKEAKAMVKGYPIEKMLPYILQKDRKIASFMIAIAKKESSWGEHVPVLKGQDCYNYWGYRGQRKLMGTGGHTCFNSKKDAVDTVAKRIETLVEENGRDTAKKMVVWKCGESCAATGGQAAANKWISDVNSYYSELMN